MSATPEGRLQRRRTVKEEDEDAAEDALSFGTTLDRFMSSETPPKRRSTRLATSSPRSVKLEHDNIPSASTSQNSYADVKLEEPSTPTSETRPKPKSRTSSSKKRKVMDTGQYEGMKEVPDRLAEDLDILFCGCNPGVRSSELGYHYAHPSNRFYRVLHEAGLTPHRLHPSESPDMPVKYKLGLTDSVQRCTARADQVPSLEFQAGAVKTLQKMMKWRPLVVCFVGMDVYRNFRKHLLASIPAEQRQRIVKRETPAKGDVNSPISPSKRKQSTSDVQLGLQNIVVSVPDPSKDGRHLVRLVALPSTSGLAAGYTDADRVGYLSEAKAIAVAIRSGSHRDREDAVLINAEDYLSPSVALQVKAESKQVKALGDRQQAKVEESEVELAL